MPASSDHVASLARDAELDVMRLTNWGERRTTRWIVAAMITHDAYHAGEINHLRSLSSTATTGGDTSSSGSAEPANAPDEIRPAAARRSTSALERSLVPEGNNGRSGVDFDVQGPLRRPMVREPDH